ncbi:salt tolerance receptor-like cytoplasmic kinase 1 [Diospyros lotus]|uniref:salt tolerance receptor-like cytoplasmic kinase 1 n=1 Tax=Diospyros lotus TaxID=55363 RepID=UPI00225828BF|nr:salt tolerance receptor-like cytoplasmic kinase 1 [Diospyros lotus]
MAFLSSLKLKMRRRRRRCHPNENATATATATTTPDGAATKPNDDLPHDVEIDQKKMRRFSWGEISDLTRPIGSGGFSTVYLAQLPDSTVGAVKIQNCSSERLRRAYGEELKILRRLRHDNIIKLLGHCDDRSEEGVLVLEFVPNGNLREKLHNSSSILPWRNRMAIAFQLAQAIEYLHEQCSLHIIHGDIKPSNVLLDPQLNCKLCDFGSAKMEFSSSVAPGSSCSAKLLMLGSPGYVDPHYLSTGIASKKNDVYSFGALVLELITGIEAFGGGRRLQPPGDDAAEVAEMVDARLNGEFEVEEARVMASIAASCLANSPALRPSVAHILSLIKDKIASISFLFSTTSSNK